MTALIKKVVQRKRIKTWQTVTGQYNSIVYAAKSWNMYICNMQTHIRSDREAQYTELDNYVRHS